MQMIKANEYKEYLDSYAWKSLKKNKLKDTPICELCWNKATTVHHLSYERLWKEKDSDIASVCKLCHKECHYLEWNQIKNDEKVLRKRFEELKEKYTSWEENIREEKVIDYDDYPKWPSNNDDNSYSILFWIAVVWFFLFWKASNNWIGTTIQQILFWIFAFIFPFLIIKIITKLFNIKSWKSEYKPWAEFGIWFILYFLFLVSMFEKIFWYSLF